MLLNETFTGVSDVSLGDDRLPLTFHPIHRVYGTINGRQDTTNVGGEVVDGRYNPSVFICLGVGQLRWSLTEHLRSLEEILLTFLPSLVVTVLNVLDLVHQFALLVDVVDRDADTHNFDVICLSQ